MTYVLLLVIINARKSSIYLADFSYLTVIQINSFSLNCQNLTCTLGLDDPTQTHSSLLLIQLHRIFLKSEKNQWPRSKLAYFKNPTALSQDTSATCSPLNFAIGTRCQALKKGFPAKGLFTHITQGPTNTPPWSLLSRIDAQARKLRMNKSYTGLQPKNFGTSLLGQGLLICLTGVFSTPSRTFSFVHVHWSPSFLTALSHPPLA